MMPPARIVNDDDNLRLSLSLNCSSTASKIREVSTSCATGDVVSGMNRSSIFQMATPSVARQMPVQLNLMMMPSASSSSSSAAHPSVYNSSSLLRRNSFTAASLQTKSGSFWNNNLFHQYNNTTTTTDRTSDSPRLATTTTTTCTAFAGSADPRSFLKGIDVNRRPSTSNNAADEDDAGVSSPNSTLSSVSGKRSERETGTNNYTAGSGDDERGGGTDDEDGEAARKKLRLSKDQSAVLEESFKEHNTLNPKQKLALAKRLGLRPRQVEVWFQNRRARTKLKQTEVDCEFLKRCCEQLTDENKRLQKEVQELRALKLSPQFYMQMTPPTTLTMCPSCERVGSGSNNNNTNTETPLTSSTPSHNHHHHHHHHNPSGTMVVSTEASMNTRGLNTGAASHAVPNRLYEALQPRP